jgi:hypothetical protein
MGSIMGSQNIMGSIMGSQNIMGLDYGSNISEESTPPCFNYSGNLGCVIVR